MFFSYLYTLSDLKGSPRSDASIKSFNMSSVPLTRRQRQIVDFLQEYTDDKGLSPTYGEIAEHFGVNMVTIPGRVSDLDYASWRWHEVSEQRHYSDPLAEEALIERLQKAGTSALGALLAQREDGEAGEVEEPA